MPVDLFLSVQGVGIGWDRASAEFLGESRGSRCWFIAKFLGACVLSDPTNVTGTRLRECIDTGDKTP